MKMVLTLKSGAQVRADVTEFSTGKGRHEGDLRELKWTTPDLAAVKLHYVDLGEVAAIHAEYENGSVSASSRAGAPTGGEDEGGTPVTGEAATA